MKITLFLKSPKQLMIIFGVFGVRSFPEIKFDHPRFTLNYETKKMMLNKGKQIIRFAFRSLLFPFAESYFDEIIKPIQQQGC